MNDPKPSNIIPPANEKFSETYTRLVKEGMASEINRPETMWFYPLLGSLFALALRLIGRLVHRSR
jgi:hypothetical protein